MDHTLTYLAQPAQVGVWECQPAPTQPDGRRHPPGTRPLWSGRRGFPRCMPWRATAVDGPARPKRPGSAMTHAAAFIVAASGGGG